MKDYISIFIFTSEVISWVIIPVIITEKGMAVQI